MICIKANQKQISPLKWVEVVKPVTWTVECQSFVSTHHQLRICTIFCSRENNSKKSKMKLLLIFFLVVCVFNEQYTYGKLKQNKLNKCNNVKTIKKKYNINQNIWKNPETSNSSSVSTSQISATKQGPCNCGGGLCECCSRLLFNVWKQTACVKVSYDPDEFSFTAKVLMNERLLYTRTVSGKYYIFFLS